MKHAYVNLICVTATNEDRYTLPRTISLLEVLDQPDDPNIHEMPPELRRASPDLGIVNYLSDSSAFTQIHPINNKIGWVCPLDCVNNGVIHTFSV